MSAYVYYFAIGSGIIVGGVLLVRACLKQRERDREAAQRRAQAGHEQAAMSNVAPIQPSQPNSHVGPSPGQVNIPIQGNTNMAQVQSQPAVKVSVVPEQAVNVPPWAQIEQKGQHTQSTQPQYVTGAAYQPPQSSQPIVTAIPISMASAQPIAVDSSDKGGRSGSIIGKPAEMGAYVYQPAPAPAPSNATAPPPPY